MYNKKIIYIAALLALIFTYTPINAQTLSLSDTLKEVKVVGQQNRSTDVRLNQFSPGLKLKIIDSQTLQQYQLQNMANLLAQQAPVFVKSYGFNSLATLNFRGSSAAQTMVLWNGIPIQNAALGIADVATLPVLFMEKVNIVYGGSAALWGSGNVGGALMLESDAPKFDSGKKTLSLLGGMGSYQQYMYGLKASYSNQHWYFSTNFFAQTAINNFAYTNLYGQQEKMTNSGLLSYALMLKAAYKINAMNTISITGWYQAYQRAIPPALFEVGSDKIQVDKSLRLLLDYTRQTTNTNLFAKAALNRDEITYNDDVVLLHTNNVAYQYYQEVGVRRQLGALGQIVVFAPLQTAMMVTDALSQNKTYTQTKTAIAGAYQLKLYHNRINIAANAREEVINKLSVFSPGVDGSYAITQWWVLRANMQRTYRVPSLNELYYFPGGNANLKPEQGWTQDVGYAIKLKYKNITFTHDVSCFNRNIHDWILWLGGAVWTPYNIAEVHSRGVETENNFVYNMGNWRLHLGINTAYILASTTTSYIPNDGSVGKQIPYTPRYNGQLNVGFSYRQFAVYYNHTYTGYRFITTDESQFLLPYQTGNLQFMCSISIYHHALQLSAQCNNLWNQQYEVVAYRPMPGINWLIGAKINVL